MLGSSRVEVGDLTLDLARRALQGELADIVYTDPPWGPGLLRYFRTLNGEPQVETNWGVFLTNLCKVLSTHSKKGGHIFVEMGPQWADETEKAMGTVGLPVVSRWDVVYGSPKRPSILLYSGPGASCVPTGMSGTKMTTHVLKSVAVPNALVFDPCCGKGMTARCAVRLGMRFAGVELNPKRGAVTQAWLKAREARGFSS